MFFQPEMLGQILFPYKLCGTAPQSIPFDQGVWGAILAVFLTFVITIPVRLWMVAKIIGGIYFPMRFFTRILFVSLTSAYTIELCLTPEATWLILVMTPAYLTSMVFLCSLFPIFEASDESDLNQISQHKLQVIFTLFSKLRAKLFKRDTVLDISYQETTSCQK